MVQSCGDDYTIRRRKAERVEQTVVTEEKPEALHALPPAVADVKITSI